MQIVNCDVHLGGDRNHVVPKTGVTVAEIEILRVLHGEDSVVNINPTKQDTRKHAEELDRLRKTYKRKLPGPDSKGSKNIVDTVYPGPRPNLPATLKDIGVDYPTASKAKKKSPAKDAADAEAKAQAEAEAAEQAQAEEEAQAAAEAAKQE
jgi:hypothetical protein